MQDRLTKDLEVTSRTAEQINATNSARAIKEPCLIETISNITLFGAQTVNGQAVVAGDRVLVMAQTTASENGIYVVQENAWLRAADFDSARDFTTGTLVPVVGGSVYRLATALPIVLDTTALSFTVSAFFAAGELTDAASVIFADELAEVEGFKTQAEAATISAAASANTATTKANEIVVAASSASTAANTATTKASEASGSASSAATSASTATAKATEAADSANTATVKASEATAAAGTATTKAGEASSSASTASTAATAATAAKLAAEAARDSALASFDGFDDRYLGPKSADPTVDNDGNALMAGTLYFFDGNGTPANAGMWIYTGSAWVAAYISGDGLTTDSVPEGPSRLYFTASRVWNTVLTGISFVTNVAITATDTVLGALGKLQAQLTAHFGSTGASHGVATTSVNGFMSSADKLKIDGYRQRLTANTTFYVAPTGSDSNDGLTAGTPKLTIQAAFNLIRNSYDCGGYVVTIQLADGTYTTGLNASILTGQHGVTLTGNTSSPANVIISTTNAHCITASANSYVIVSGITFTTTTGGTALYAFNAGQIYFNNVVFGTCAGNHINATQGGRIIANGNYTISGGAAWHICSDWYGFVDVSGRTITITNTPTFVYSFLICNMNSVIGIYSNTFSGSAIGSRYIIYDGGMVFTNQASLTYLPGNAVGVGEFDGGQYLGNYNLSGVKVASFNQQNTTSATTGSMTIDWSAGACYSQASPTGAITYTFAAPPAYSRLQLTITANATTQTFTWPASVIWLGATWAMTASKHAVITFWYDGTSYWASGSNQV